MGYTLIDRETNVTIELGAKHQEGAFWEALERLNYGLGMQIESVDELTLYQVRGGVGTLSIFVYALHGHDAERYAENMMGMKVTQVDAVESSSVAEYRALRWPGAVYSAYPNIVAVDEETGSRARGRRHYQQKKRLR